MFYLTNALSTFHLRLYDIGYTVILHDWCNKGRGVCYPVCGMVHIKDPLLLIGKSSPCNGGSGIHTHYLSDPLPYV